MFGYSPVREHSPSLCRYDETTHLDNHFSQRHLCVECGWPLIVEAFLEDSSGYHLLITGRRMKCNIDQRGANIRRTMGLLLLLVAVALAVAGYFIGWWWLWMVAGAAAGGGAFALFEARQKWCALRAMGIETRV
jgi:hypothetical protein